MQVKAILAAGIMSCLAGCGISIQQQPSGAGEYRFIELTGDQMNAVKQAVKQVVTDTGSFGDAKALRLPGLEGLHVCGHVRSTAQDLAYYMELNDGSGPPEVKRGQVGTDEGKLAKVKFMCRHHGSV